MEEVARRITSTDPNEIMPPPDSHKTLSPEDTKVLLDWIASGAAYAEHWSFVPPQDHVPPKAALDAWNEHLIDRFVLARLEQLGMSPSALADRRTLLRRLSLDLTGLPPSRDELQAFLEDDAPGAYERQVDRLLASPHFGEHVARLWLDLVRFADTNGLHHDHYREMTPYRDWVIRAFNDNLPFDQFIKYQLAGDLYADATIDQQIASGFNRLHLIIDVGTALPEESFTRNVVDRVTAVGTAFMGLTVECAVCHDHKYDPITQRDFYQLYAFFNNFDGEAETGWRRGPDFFRGLQPPYIDLPTTKQKAHLYLLEREIAAAEQQIDAENEVEADTEGEQLESKLEGLQSRRDALLRTIPAALVMKERSVPRPAHLLIRGNYDQPGERVERDTPQFLPPLDYEGDIPTRMDLANWLVDADHPLTARVAVNRFWQQLFGVGLVKTSEDFGAQGEPPSHPQLLDYLSRRFVDSGWDVKLLVRSIVLSQTYRQSSAALPSECAADPENRLLARGSRFRLDAEVIRDQLLACTGRLKLTMFGRSVKPPQPDGLWEIVAMPSSYPNKYEPDTGEQTRRRSVYTFWKRSLPPPQMTIFDAPTRESCIARRERTNTPLQALLLMNEPEFFAAARHMAQEVAANDADSDTQKLHALYETITCYEPTDRDLERLKVALNHFRSSYHSNVQAAVALTDGVVPSAQASQLGDQHDVEIAAWTMIVHSLLNLDAVKNRE